MDIFIKKRIWIVGMINNCNFRRLRAWQGQRGSALPAVLLAILVITLLGTGLLSLVSLERRSSINDERISQATYLAEAGINLALAKLRQDPAWRQGISRTFVPQAGGEIAGVSISTLPASYCLRSTGEVEGIKRVLEVHLARPCTDYALACAGSISLKNPVIVNGDLFSGGSIWLQKGANGNVAAAGDLTAREIVKGSVITGGYMYNSGVIRGDAMVGRCIDKYGRDPNYYGTIYGRLTKGHELSWPTLPVELAASYASDNYLAPGGYTMAEMQAMVDSFAGDIKTLYCDGDLLLTNPQHGSDTDYYTGKAIIVAAGDIHLGKDILATTVADAWAFIAAGDLLLDGGVTVEAMLVCDGYFYKQGAESIINGLLLTGGILEIDDEGGDSDQQDKSHGKGCIKGKLTINYDADKVKGLLLGPVTAVGPVLSWRHISLQQ